MPAVQEELDRFHEFASAQVSSGRVDTLQELFDLWSAENPTDAELHESLASMQRGLADAEAGRVRSADDVIRDLRHELALR